MIQLVMHESKLKQYNVADSFERELVSSRARAQTQTYAHMNVQSNKYSKDFEHTG